MTGCGCKSDRLSPLSRFLRDEDGATAIEYGLIVSLIFLAITAAVNGFTTETNNLYSTIESALEN